MISINVIIFCNYMFCEVYKSHPWRHGYPPYIRRMTGGYPPSGWRVLEDGVRKSEIHRCCLHAQNKSKYFLCIKKSMMLTSEDWLARHITRTFPANFTKKIYFCFQKHVFLWVKMTENTGLTLSHSEKKMLQETFYTISSNFFSFISVRQGDFSWKPNRVGAAAALARSEKHVSGDWSYKMGYFSSSS